MDDEYLYIPTINQQKMISLLIIPPSILSFIGSSLIIYHVTHGKKKSPYRRLQFALSFCDIISTIVWISQPYLESTDAIRAYVWSFGNETTCTALGFLTQFTITSHLYLAALSIYFLLSIRFGVREATFAKKYEIWMHLVIILFGLGTSISGVVMGMYYVSHIGPGCWVSHPPEGDICENDSCGAHKLAWIFAGFPTVLVLMCIAACNLLLYCHVRATVVQGQKRALESEKRLAMYNNNGSQIFGDDDSAQNIFLSKRSVLQSSDKQWKRVRDVGTQSFFYVGAYLLCFSWSMIKQVLDGQGFDKIPGSGAYFLPLIVLQSIFLPAQGLFNALIFFRPKYNQFRTMYPNESRLWSMKRAIFGATIKPLNRNVDDVEKSPQSKNKLMCTSKRIHCTGELVSSTAMPGIPRIPRKTVSSMIASDSDFDHVLGEDEEDECYGDSSSHDHQQCLPMHRTVSGKSSLVDGLDSSLEVISETSTSVIESMNALSEVGDEHGRHTPMDSDHTKSRWHSRRSSNSEQMNVAVSISPTMPKISDSDLESLDANLSSSNSSNNSEILAPSHKVSPHTSILRASSEDSMQSSSEKSMDTSVSV